MSVRVALLCSLGWVVAAAAQEVVPVPEFPVVVVADRLPEAGGLEILSPERRAGALDAGALLEREPGLRVVRNGALTGMPQMGGVFGDRINIRVDGMQLTPACPNHMDPPLHYVSPQVIGDVEIERVSPVSRGGDSLGPSIAVERHPALYTEAWTEGAVVDGSAGFHYLGSHHGVGGHARSRVGTDRWSAGYSGSIDAGGNQQFPGGEIRASEYFSQEHHLYLAHRSEAGEWTLRLGTNRAEDVGTPALPMDMIEDTGATIGLAYEKEWEGWALEGSVYFHHVDHLMDRYTLRPFVPGPPATGGNPPVETGATSRDIGGKLVLNRDLDALDGGILRAGTDVHLSALEAVSYNTATGMHQDLFNDARRNRIGFFLEWEQDWSPSWRSVVGARGDIVSVETGAIARTMSAVAAADALAFNAADRDRVFANADAALRLEWDPASPWRMEWGLARKSRAPGYVELFNYTPAQSTAGLADGREYTGNLDLDSEVAWQVEWVAAWEDDTWEIRATPYFSAVQGFIQGRPQARLFAGQPVLRYENVDAEIYGVVADGIWKWHENLALTGSLSYTRGRDVENHDNLYRIAPLQGEIGLDHTWGGWSARLAVELIDAQNDVAAYNGELPTGGVALLNLQAAYAFDNGITLVAGLVNATDEDYQDHLDGINRVPGSDVARGARLPSPGRYFHGSVSWKF